MTPWNTLEDLHIRPLVFLLIILLVLVVFYKQTKRIPCYLYTKSNPTPLSLKSSPSPNPQSPVHSPFNIKTTLVNVPSDPSFSHQKQHHAHLLHCSNLSTINLPSPPPQLSNSMLPPTQLNSKMHKLPLNFSKETLLPHKTFWRQNDFKGQDQK